MTTPGRRLIGYFARYKGKLVAGGVCVMLSAAFSLVKPLVVGSAVDALKSELRPESLGSYASLYLAAAVVQGIFLFFHRRILIGASREIEYDMRGDFFSHLQLLPNSFYQVHRTGDLMSRATSDLAAVRMLVGPAVMHSFSSLLVVVGAFAMMLRIDASLAGLSLLAVPTIIFVVVFFGQKIHARFLAVQEYFGEISAKVQENLAGVRVVRAFGREESEVAEFSRMNRVFVDKNRRLIVLTATFYPLLHTFMGVMFVLVFFVGGRRMLAGTMTVGDFVAFMLYLGRLVWPLIALGWVINLFQRGMASMKRLHEIWSADPRIEEEAGEAPEDELPASIEIRNLTFGYGDKPVLRNVSLTVREGETLGIVGRTGSGKSTLLSLLTRIWEPPPGTVFVGGVAVEELAVRHLREKIGMVPQETFLFSDSIAENVRFGRMGATDEEVAEVLDLAGLTEDLGAFPEGIRTVIGERGVTLSGGQKQRTAIARAIIRNPAIMILDDALSAVDTHTEERILASLRKLREGRTVVVVSHRISSVKDADEIVVLDEGRVVERGNHDQLMRTGGFYADLYRRQALEDELEEIA
jgi:ATP-binding cassette, subfamily B, multidrug efflux pump